MELQRLHVSLDSRFGFVHRQGSLWLRGAQSRTATLYLTMKNI
jgi:hypothetical protein